MLIAGPHDAYRYHQRAMNRFERWMTEQALKPPSGKVFDLPELSRRRQIRNSTKARAAQKVDRHPHSAIALLAAKLKGELKPMALQETIETDCPNCGDPITLVDFDPEDKTEETGQDIQCDTCKTVWTNWDMVDGALVIDEDSAVDEDELESDDEPVPESADDDDEDELDDSDEATGILEEEDEP